MGVLGMAALLPLVLVALPLPLRSSSSRPAVKEISTATWVRITLELEGRVPPAALLGAPVACPELREVLAAEDITLESFRRTAVRLATRAQATVLEEDSQAIVAEAGEICFLPEGVTLARPPRDALPRSNVSAADAVLLRLLVAAPGSSNSILPEVDRR